MNSSSENENILENVIDEKMINSTGSDEPDVMDIIKFSTNDNNFCHKITGKNVKIICSTGNHDHGSSKVKLKDIVDYKWEIKKYPGHLIAVHMDGIHIAYVIKVNNKQTGTEEGMVRVVNTQSSQRSLIKGINGEVLDVQFAQIERIHILACIDNNSLYVHKIDMLSDNLICNLLLKIEDPIDNFPKYNKISWCPFYQVEYTSSDDEGDDASQLIVWSRGKIFQCFNVNIIINSHGVGKHNPKDLTDGYLQSIDNTITITWISLSPDGTTLCAGSEDGFIRFYQVYFHEKQPRCLHQWKPHNGKPISSFFFLDNYLKKSSSETFWKHALTGSNHNTEFKIWDCGTWECLQKIQLVSEIQSTNDINQDQPKLPKELNLTAEIDITSSYLVLSNIDGRTLYILQIGHELKKEMKNSINDISKAKKLQQQRHKRKAITYIRSVSEFPLSSPILSYSIVNATIRKLYKCALNDSYLLDEIDYDYDEENLAISCVVVRMFVVQPKSVQECNILYQPINTNDEEEEDIDDDDIKITDDEDSSDDIKIDTSDEDLLVIKGVPYKDVLVSGYPNKKLLEIATDASQSSGVIGVTIPGLDKSSPLHSDENNLLIKAGRKSISPLIPGLAKLDTPQISNESSIEIPFPPVIVPPQSAVTLNHAQKSHFSTVNLMTPDEFSSTSSATSTTSIIPVNNSTNSATNITTKKSPAESVNSDVLSTILMLASVTGSQNQKQNSENLNLLYYMNNIMIEQQQQKQQQQQQQQLQQQQQQSTTTNKNKFISLEDDENIKIYGNEDDLLSEHNNNSNNLTSIEDDNNIEIYDDDDDDVIRGQNNSGNLTSGGSSPPSREVQEILSLKDYEFKLSNFSYNEQEIGTVNVVKLPQPPENFLNTSEMINTKTQQLLNSAASNSLKNNQNLINNDYKNNKDNEIDGIIKKNISSSSNENSLINWPKVPDTNIVINKKIQHNITSDNDHSPINPSQSTNSIPSNYNTNNNSNNNNYNNGEQLQDITSKLDSLMDIIHLQTNQIKDLQNEIISFKNHKDNATSINNKQIQSNYIELTRQTERQFLQLFEQNFNRYEKENRLKRDDFFIKFESNIRDLREQMHQANQLHFNQLFDKISKTIKIEIQNKIIPILVVKMDTIQAQFKTEVATKITTTDQALRESISQLCKSKSIIETFGKSVLLGVQGSLQAAFIESMSSTLIPAYEKSSQSMFRQLHETFSFGIKQVMEQFDIYLHQLQPVQDSTDAILSRCMQIRELLETNVSHNTNSLSETMNETKQEIKALEKNVIQNFTELIKKEIRKSFEQQVATLEDSVLSVVRSQANTPAPSSQVMSVYDVQDQIKHLLSLGQINAAFHQALLANNLNLVEYTLEKADYKNVFNPCILEQTVLLSLIQQISADMSQHNDVKQQYLADGLLNLNQTDPITREHAPKVIKELIKNCQLFLAANPNSSLASNIRMIIMASQGMGYKI